MLLLTTGCSKAADAPAGQADAGGTPVVAYA